MSAGTMAITMAGRGSRFVEAGYYVPKYEIIVHGRSLFDWSMDGLAAFRDAGWVFYFATRSDLDARSFLTKHCTQVGIDVGGVLELDGVTDGQATTALALAEIAPDNAPFAVFNIDTHLRAYALRPWNIEACDGIVPCFPGLGESWSFARLGQEGFAVELREKERISPHASVGFYGFASAGDYIRGYRRHFATNCGSAHGERYIAPMYNTLIAEGARIAVPLLEAHDVTVLGTPSEVATFASESPRSTEWGQKPSRDEKIG